MWEGARLGTSVYRPESRPEGYIPGVPSVPTNRARWCGWHCQAGSDPHTGTCTVFSVNLSAPPWPPALLFLSLLPPIKITQTLPPEGAPSRLCSASVLSCRVGLYKLCTAQFYLLSYKWCPPHCAVLSLCSCTWKP